MNIMNKKPGRAWLIAKRLMAAVLVILGAAARCQTACGDCGRR